MNIRIIPAKESHAPFIGKAITMAIGEEIVNALAGESHSSNDVRELFTSLAARTDTQYSYLNTLIAVNEEEQPVGVAVSYDGADLHKLRPPFFEEAEKKIGLILKGEPVDETDPEEVYLDTLAVFPEYRGNGIGRRLILATFDKAGKAGKPLGLLVSKTNPTARRLYNSVGFEAVGDRPFAGEMMDHLLKTR